MLSLETLLGIVCTEAIEHGGVQEVPDNKHGAPQYYHALMRAARDASSDVAPSSARNLKPIQFNLELVQTKEDGLAWEE